MDNSTRRIENNKSLKKELIFIDNINSLNKLRIDIVNDKQTDAFLTRTKGQVLLQISARLIDNEFENTELSFFIDDNIYKTDNIGNTSSHTELKDDKSISFETIVELNSFKSEKFKQKGYYKAFFETDIKDIHTFHREFETVTYQSDGKEYYYDCIRVSFNDKDFDVVQVKYNGKGFYVFECLQENTYDDFSSICFSIQQAIGFINKLMVGREKFTFDHAGNCYYSNYIRPTLRGMYNPIITNPYSYLDIKRNAADFYLNKLTRITLATFSELVCKIHNEPEFSVAILVLLEATSIRSLLIIPSSFAGIIEQLSKHLSLEEIGLEKPISQPKHFDKILKELHEVIDTNSQNLSITNTLKLKRRLNEINKPINKAHLTNNEKLTRPFEQLGIPLSLHDIAIIEHRNDLLHGNILLKKDDEIDEVNTNLYMAYVSAKLFTLISKLVLKSVGYKGYVYNQAKYLEKNLNIQTNEAYFDEI